MPTPGLTVRAAGLSVRPTRDGVACAVFALALAGVGALTGQNLLDLVAAVLLALLGLEGAAGLGNVVGLAVRRELPDEAFAGVPARGAWRVRRTLPWPAFDVDVEEAGLDPARARAAELGVGVSRVPVSWTFRRRGARPLRAVRLRSSWPFGLLDWERVIPEPATCEAWPLPLPGRPVDEDEGRRGRTADPEELDDLRPYRPGDRLRDVHWAASARVGQPMVAVRRGRADAPVWVEVPADAVGEERERAVGEATGAVLDAIAAGRLVGLRADGQAWPPRTGGAWRRHLLSVLAALPETTP